MSFVRVPINLCYRLMCLGFNIIRLHSADGLSPIFLQKTFMLAKFSLDESLFCEFHYHECISV
jgi:hypothetical protein